MTNLTWTKAKPTLPGHYWFRIAGALTPRIRQIEILDDRLWVFSNGQPIGEMGDGFEFAGPIDLPEEPVVEAEQQLLEEVLVGQQAQIDKLQEQIDKLIKTNNANNTGALRLCDHVLDLNRLLEKKASKDELDERSSEIRKQVLEAFARMADTLVEILKD